MTKILNYIWRGWFVILGIILTLLLAPPILLLSIRRENYRHAYVLVRLWCYGMFYGMGFRYTLRKWTDKKLDKNRQYVFIANHTSMMDVMLPCILMPHHPLSYVGKAELAKVPIFGMVYRRIFVMVDRKSPKSRAEVYIRCAERMAEGNSIVIFPEGRVPDDTSIVLDQFKDGAFSLSTKHQAPIAVFAFEGLKEMFPFDKSKGHPGRVIVHFLDVLEPAPLETNKTKAFNQIKSVLRE